jgi:4-hydroxythreonine-4-phosphate dehydrogenase
MAAPPPVEPADRPVARRLGVTLGDARGIGPEVAERAISLLPAEGRPELLLIGPEGVQGIDAGDSFQSVGRWSAGGSPAEAGRLAGLAIEEAVRMAMAGRIAGIVTAPIDKAALHAAGYNWPGHTEMLAALSGAPHVSMLMSAERTIAGHPLRVVLATTHIRLADVTRMLNAESLVRQTELLADALRTGWAIDEPRIAFCAVNPHASDGGLFGDEEETILRPAIDILRAGGHDVRGPFPADTVFVRALRDEFDAVVAPYHDVGMAAFKTASFGSGVNVTLGLPFVRTSPDHGTALDIAGRGIADASSMVEAIMLAARLAGTLRLHATRR